MTLSDSRSHLNVRDAGEIELVRRRDVNSLSENAGTRRRSCLSRFVCGTYVHHRPPLHGGPAYMMIGMLGGGSRSAALRWDGGSARRPARQPWRMGVVREAAVSERYSGQQRRGEAGRRAVRQGWIVEGIGRRGSWSMFHVYGSGSVEYRQGHGRSPATGQAEVEWEEDGEGERRGRRGGERIHDDRLTRTTRRFPHYRTLDDDNTIGSGAV
ncbi:hypothetical protein M430DRAFT_55974 [Amorphotheca resinae ATCC 22711]|uniref:Uncharacterized protein n=1 Tax=Amorphotheca resinae ATCC 22711 TaxID=857342 RepID=A0A2T3BA61_AMORE|nr:hypothetical protein M430DRAFT_55974 [Amorphotheca resinae ATCC 22711]PSS25169.1 hypothetical protein M430DRAFT_55974 [Amorphotheca resinae ATCC 22711]